jgi:hypothetical protein
VCEASRAIFAEWADNVYCMYDCMCVCAVVLLFVQAVVRIEETKQRMEAAGRLYDIQAKIDGVSSHGRHGWCVCVV